MFYAFPQRMSRRETTAVNRSAALGPRRREREAATGSQEVSLRVTAQTVGMSLHLPLAKTASAETTVPPSARSGHARQTLLALIVNARVINKTVSRVLLRGV